MGVAATLVIWPNRPKYIWLIENYLRSISINFCPNIFNNLAVNTIFQFSPLKVYGNSKLPGNQIKEPIFIKTLTFNSPSPRMLQMKFGPNLPSGLRGDVVWKCYRRRQMTDRQTTTDDNDDDGQLPILYNKRYFQCTYNWSASHENT